MVIAPFLITVSDSFMFFLCALFVSQAKPQPYKLNKYQGLQLPPCEKQSKIIFNLFKAELLIQKNIKYLLLYSVV